MLYESMEPSLDARSRDRLRTLLEHGPRGAHLADEAWIALAERRPVPGDTGQVLEHLSRCPECRDVLRAVQLLDRGRAGLRSATHLPGRSTWVGRVAAVAATVIAGSGLWLVTSGRPEPSPLAATTASRAPRDVPATPSTWLDTLPLTVPAVAIYSPDALTMRGETTATFADAFGTAMQPWDAGRFAEVAQRLSAVTASHPGIAEGHFYRGVALLLSGSPGDAIAPLTRATALAPDRLAPDAWWYLGLAHVRRGDRDDAARALARACRLGRTSACDAADRPAPEAVPRP